MSCNVGSIDRVIRILAGLGSRLVLPIRTRRCLPALSLASGTFAGCRVAPLLSSRGTAGTGTPLAGCTRRAWPGLIATLVPTASRRVRILR